LATQRRISSRLRFGRHLDEQRANPDPKVDSKGRPVEGVHRTLPRLYRELYRILQGHRTSIVLSLLALSLGTLLKLIPPAATKLVIDYVLLGRAIPSRWSEWVPIPPTPRGRLFALVVVVLVVTALGLVVGLWSRWKATLASKRVQVVARRAVFEHASRLPLHRVHELKAGGASSMLREDAGGVGELIFSMLYNPWRAIVQFAGGVVVLAWVDWRLLLGAVALAPVAFAANRYWDRKLRPLYRAIRKQRQDIDAKATESFGGMRVVRAFGRRRREAARFVEDVDYMARQELHAWWWTRAVEIIWELLLPAASGALLLYGGLRVLEGQLTPGDLMMFLVYLAMLLEPMAVLATSVAQLQGNLSGFDRVLDLLAESLEMPDAPGSLAVSKAAVAGRISLQNVTFRYPGAEVDVLKGIDLEVEPGEVIALVGRSGAGKTTLCNLVARFFDPNAGTVRLDGVDLRSIRVESYRKLLGVVEQDVFLFDGTIAENIAYADPRASDAAIARAANLAHADIFIEALADGYDTRIGERGVKLSGGQRQRLAIARAILADPKVFILDEATSNLDTESEMLIRQGLATLIRGRTSFVIAHRLSTIRDADRILVLDEGRIVESGTHDELMSDGGRYREMVELQSLGTT